MNDTIKAIAEALCRPTLSCAQCRIINCVQMRIAEEIYTAHVKPLESALVKAEADRAVLVEVLEKCVPVLEAADEFFNGVAGGLNQARAALARAKGEV